MKLRYITSVIIVLLISCPVLGQVAGKKHLSEADYGKWGTLNINRISQKGGWTSYEMNYDTKNDTLFLQNTGTKVQYAYPKGREGRFGGEELFAYLSESDLKVVNLKNNKITSVKEVKRFELPCDGRYIVTLHNTNMLKVINSKGVVVTQMDAVSDYKLNPAKNALVYNRKVKENYESGFISFDTYTHYVIAAPATAFNRFVWQQNGKDVVLSNANGLLYYRSSENRLFEFDVKSIATYEDAQIVSNGLSELSVSKDGLKVFFSIAAPLPKVPRPDNAVAIWNGNDECLYPTRQELAKSDIPKLAVWFPDTGVYKILSDDSLYRYRLTESNNYVLLSNPYSYGLEPDYYEKVDYYIKDVWTGAEKLLLKKQSHDPNQLVFAPHSDILLYYQDKNWWLYNPADESLKNLTEDLKTDWDNTDSDMPISFKVYGIAGWIRDGKSVLIYDKNDIWEVALDGSQQKRVTQGKEQSRIYRISSVEYKNNEGQRKIIDSKKEMILKIESMVDKSTGYAVYNKTTGVRTLFFDNKYVSAIAKSKNGSLIFTSQTFSQPPQVEFMKSNDTVPKTLFKSNLQQAKYYYGKAELIRYTNREGRELSGALFYPADYDPAKSYPMVVNVYEKRSELLHQYSNPTLYNSDGFCVTNFTLNGYFVLMPDIAYKMGSPGISASECISAAVKKVLATNPIDPLRVGLIGHSFGGYETNFAITQTDIFAAAVSGAGISDIEGHYFSLDKNGTAGKDGMWRYENQQFRMGASFYGDKQGYWQNSPTNHADHIKTPLLLWAGEKDRVVPYEQSITMYLALRRLGLPNILLSYPNEDHNIKLRNHQKDLTYRIMEWFDYYLKGKTEAGWIKNGTAQY